METCFSPGLTLPQRLLLVALHAHNLLLRAAWPLIRIPLAPFRKKGRVLFLSRQSDAPSIDFLRLADALRADGRTCAFLTRRLEKDNPRHILRALFLPLRQMVQMALAEACVTDTYQPVLSLLPHPRLRTIQIWHAAAAFKKFGLDALKTPFDRAVARAMKMHAGYDLVVASSTAAAPGLAAGFGRPPSDLAICPLPRLLHTPADRDAALSRLRDADPALLDAPFALYVPTFRRTGRHAIPPLLDAFRRLAPSLRLVVKPHPRMKNLSLPDAATLPRAATDDLLAAAALVLTDYSAIAVEAAAWGVPVLLHPFDAPLYDAEEGLNPLPPELPAYPGPDNLARAARAALRAPPDQSAFRRQHPPAAPSDIPRLARLVLPLPAPQRPPP